MSRWSNRFASAVLLALLAACQSLSGGKPSGAAAVPHDQPSAAASASDPSPSAAPPSVVDPDAARRYAAALHAMKSGDSAQAERELQELTLAYPDYSGPPLNLGLIYLQKSRLPEAETAFETALARNPANAAAGNELGIVERRLGKFTAAEAAYHRTLAATPDYAPAHLNLGVLYDLYLAEPQKALEQFEMYLQLAGDNKQVSGWVIELRKRVAAHQAKKEAA